MLTFEVVGRQAYLGHMPVLDGDAIPMTKLPGLIHPPVVKDPVLPPRTPEEVVQGQALLALPSS